VITAKAPDGRWHLKSKLLEDGNETHISRCVGEDDLQVIKPAPTYVSGTKLRFAGGQATVIDDLGDVVTLGLPAKRYPTLAGGFKEVSLSRVNIAKALLVLELL
jgi:hypothetical protein